MDGHTPLKTEDRWLLAITNLFPYVEGRTKLQKFGMLSSYEVLKDEEFFDDWRPGNYGGVLMIKRKGGIGPYTTVM